MAFSLRPAPSAFDREYTVSRVAMAQRRLLWDHLDHLLRIPGMDVLELNCGTGKESIHLARNGHRVIATDMSPVMLSRARERARQMGVEDRIVHEQLDLDDLEDRQWPFSFDLVLSGAGGLNTVDLDHLKYLVDPIADSLKPGGRFIAVVMPDRCLAETVHHFTHGRFGKAFARGRQDPIWNGLSGTGVANWFHSPKTLETAFAHRFRLVRLAPIGFFVPPLSIEPRLLEKPGTLDNLAKLDRYAAHWKWASRYSDHYLIDLERI